MEKTTRKLNDLLSQFLSLRNEVSEIADKTADAVFDSGDITKEEALTILTDNKLLPVANWICLPDFMDDYDYFSRYSTIYYMDYMYPQNFGNHEYASWSEMSYEEGINELYDFVEGNRVIGCILFNARLSEELKNFPIVREVSFPDITEIRKNTGLNVYLCVLLAQRSKSTEEATNLLNKALLNIKNGKIQNT